MYHYHTLSRTPVRNDESATPDVDEERVRHQEAKNIVGQKSGTKKDACAAPLKMLQVELLPLPALPLGWKLTKRDQDAVDSTLGGSRGRRIDFLREFSSKGNTERRRRSAEPLLSFAFRTKSSTTIGNNSSSTWEVGSDSVVSYYSSDAWEKQLRSRERHSEQQRGVGSTVRRVAARTGRRTWRYSDSWYDEETTSRRSQVHQRQAGIDSRQGNFGSKGKVVSESAKEILQVEAERVRRSDTIRVTVDAGRQQQESDGGVDPRVSTAAWEETGSTHDGHEEDYGGKTIFRRG